MAQCPRRTSPAKRGGVSAAAGVPVGQVPAPPAERWEGCRGCVGHVVAGGHASAMTPLWEVPSPPAKRETGQRDRAGLEGRAEGEALVGQALVGQALGPRGGPRRESPPWS